MTELSNSSLASQLAPTPALSAMLDHNKRMTTHLSRLATPPPALSAMLDHNKRMTTHLSRLATPPPALSAMLDHNKRMTTHLSRLATPPPALSAMLDHNKRMTTHLSRLITPPLALSVDFPKFEFPVSAFPKPKFEAAPALIGIATPPGIADLFGNAAILAGYSTRRDALTTATAVFEHSGIRDMISGSARPPNLSIPKFSIAEFLELEFEDGAFQDDYNTSAKATDLVRSQTTDIGSRRDEDRRAVYIVTKQVGKGLVLLIKWGGITVATIVAKHYLEPYLVLLPQP